MGLFSFFKNNANKNITEYYPGGRVLNISLQYDADNDMVYYKGNYGSKASFKFSDMTHAEYKTINSKQGVVIVHGQGKVLGTFDLLSEGVCQNILTWLNSHGALQPTSTDFQNSISMEAANNEVPTNEPAPVAPSVSPKSTAPDVYEDLKRLKELLDKNIITQDEFDEKKKTLLDRI